MKKDEREADEAEGVELLHATFEEMVRRRFFKVMTQNNYWRGVCDDAKELGWDPMRVHKKIRDTVDKVVGEIFVPPPAPKGSSKKSIPAPGSVFAPGKAFPNSSDFGK